MLWERRRQQVRGCHPSPCCPRGGVPPPPQRGERCGRCQPQGAQARRDSPFVAAAEPQPWLPSLRERPNPHRERAAGQGRVPASATARQALCRISARAPGPWWRCQSPQHPLVSPGSPAEGHRTLPASPTAVPPIEAFMSLFSG